MASEYSLAPEAVVEVAGALAQDHHKHLAAAGRLAPKAAEPGQVFSLVVARDPGRHWWPPEHLLPPGWREQEKRAGKPLRRRMLGLSVNDWDHVHWRQREALRKEILAAVWVAAQEQCCPAFLAGRPRVQVVYYFRRGARRDWANWTGKHLVDALVACGVLKDDSDAAIDLLRPALLMDKARPRVQFVLTDVRPPESPLEPLGGAGHNRACAPAGRPS